MKGLFLFLSLALASAFAHHHGGPSDYDRLFRTLFTEKYNKHVLPNHGVNDSTLVKFSMLPLCLELGLDGIISGRLWFRYTWNDSRLAYDPEKFGGINVIRVNPELLWTPDIVLYNREAPIDSAMYPDKSKMSNALIYSSGKVLWVPESFFGARCNAVDDGGLNLDDPWADQTCQLKYGSWTFDGNTMPLALYNDDGLDLDHYSKSCPTKVVRSTQETVNKYYDCCPEPYASNVYNITLRRNFIVSNDVLIKNPRRDLP